MAIARNAALKSSLFFTTDIMNEPIAEGGLHAKCVVLAGDGSGPTAMFEALGSRDQMAELELAAAAISAESDHQSNVVDFRSRKPVPTGALSLSFEIVADGAQGRHSTELFIFEAIGPRKSIELLAVEAKRIFR